ncbi:putative tRNA acetyltransferase [Rhodotorula paludigena]|uniref:putative tRNA acetyltransferase n=1 Tax=Rhodotorula paludigena TaxID=86838 RepID=UPI003172BC00
MAANNKSSGKGPRPGKGGAGAKGGKGKGGAGAHVYQSKRPVGGKGIFVTTVRGKESRCVGEMYDLLDEVADRLYPPERIEKMVAARQARAAEGKETAAAADDGDADKVDAETSAAPAPPAAVVDSDDEDDDEDIEASIERELAALKAGRGSGKMAPGSSKAGAADAKGKGKERPRFQSIQTDTECLCFIATAWPYDPVELTEAIVSEVQETGQSRTRFVQRLSPTTITCHSLSVEQVEQQSGRLIEQTFAAWAEANGKTTVTYAIEPSIRSHAAPLSRSVLLQLLGAQISRLASAPSISSPVPSRPILSVRADLKNPDVVLLPTVLKNVYGLSIVEGRLWRGKKFNLEQIAMEVRRRKADEEEKEKGHEEGGDDKAVEEPQKQGEAAAQPA